MFLTLQILPGEREKCSQSGSLGKAQEWMGFEVCCWCPTCSQVCILTQNALSVRDLGNNRLLSN